MLFLPESIHLAICLFISFHQEMKGISPLFKSRLVLWLTLTSRILFLPLSFSFLESYWPTMWTKSYWKVRVTGFTAPPAPVTSQPTLRRIFSWLSGCWPDSWQRLEELVILSPGKLLTHRRVSWINSYDFQSLSRLRI